MATIGPISIAANGNDGTYRYTAGAWTLESAGEGGAGVGYFGSASSLPYFLFLRFQLPSAIAGGTTIDAATIALEGLDSWDWVNGTDDLTIYATQSADAPAPADGDDYLNVEFGGTTPAAATSVVWSNITWNTSGTNTTPDIKSIIQELVNDYSGLAQNAHICVWFTGGTNGDHQVAAALLEHATGAPAALTITTSGGVSNTDRQTVVGAGTFAGVAGTRMDLGVRPLTAAELE